MEPRTGHHDHSLRARQNKGRLLEDHGRLHHEEEGSDSCGHDHAHSHNGEVEGSDDGIQDHDVGCSRGQEEGHDGCSSLHRHAKENSHHVEEVASGNDSDRCAEFRLESTSYEWRTAN